MDNNEIEVVKPKKKVHRSIAETLVARAYMQHLAGKPFDVSALGITRDQAMQMVMHRAGVKAELKDLGFTEEAAKEVVVEILNGPYKAVDRLNAADKVFKVMGSYAPEKRINMNSDLNDFLNQVTDGTRSIVRSGEAGASQRKDDGPALEAGKLIQDLGRAG